MTLTKLQNSQLDARLILTRYGVGPGARTTVKKYEDLEYMLADVLNEYPGLAKKILKRQRS